MAILRGAGLLALLAPGVARADDDGPPANAVWQDVKTRGGLTARITPDPVLTSGRQPWGEADGLIDASPARVLQHLLAFETARLHVPRLDEARVLERHDGDALVYFHLDLPWPIADRDYVARYRWRTDADGTITVTQHDENEHGPPPAGPIRVKLLRGRWRLAPDGEGGKRTRARYEFLADFGGSLPGSVREQIAWKTALETLEGVRRAIAGGELNDTR